MKKLFTLFLLLVIFAAPSQAQILKKLGNKIKDKVDQRADSKTDQTIDKGLDKTEDAAKKKPGDNSQSNTDS
ncbi:MAG: metallopeptidase, partial [Bacteroidetes bacterium]|nr:metallopeptidase [Bacteroidota bacterium]